MSLLEKIHDQPQHVREIMFGLSVVITVSLVGAIWFKDFKNDMYALLNPEEVQKEQFLAQTNQNTESLFGALGKTLGDMSSAISDLWGSPAKTEATGVENKPLDKVYLLPLSEEK